MHKIGAFFTAMIAALLIGTMAIAQSGIYVRPNSSSLPAPVAGQTWLFNSSNGQIYVYNGSEFSQISPPQSNLSAVSDPGSTDDNTKGYALGSFWLNTNNGNLWVCTNPATSAAVWVLVSSNTINAAIIPQLLYASLATGDFFPVTVIPAVPGSGLVVSLPASTGYLNGTMVTTVAGSHTYTNNSWTYDFVESNGSLTHYTQSPSTSPPSDPGLLLYNVETSGGDVTAILPYYALPGGLRNFMITPPNISGLVLQSDTTNPLGQSYGLLGYGSLSTTGASANNTLVFNGTYWSPGVLSLLGLDTSTATTGNAIQFNGTNWAAQTLGYTGGGTGLSSGGSADQLLGWTHTGSAIEYKSLTPGADVSIAGTAGHLTITVGAATTPSVTVQPGAGTVTSASATGNDFAGVLTLTTDTFATGSSVQCTFTQSASFGSGPAAVMIAPANATTAAIFSGATLPFGTVTSTGFSLTSGTSALPAGTYHFNYILHD